MYFTAIDFETTGGNVFVDDIIEVGAVKMTTKGSIVENYNTYVLTKKRIKKAAYRIHKISKAQLKKAPRILTVVHHLLNIIKDKPVVVHNAYFDIMLLAKIVRFFKLKVYNFLVFDTLGLSKALYPQLGKYNLKELACYFNVLFEEDKWHSALYDAKIAGLIFAKLASSFPYHIIKNYAIPFTTFIKKFENKINARNRNLRLRNNGVGSSPRRDNRNRGRKVHTER